VSANSQALGYEPAEAETLAAMGRTRTHGERPSIRWR
jgi:hypothetical protein